jgi:hypothetical protein
MGQVESENLPISNLKLLAIFSCLSVLCNDVSHTFFMLKTNCDSVLSRSFHPTHLMVQLGDIKIS